MTPEFSRRTMLDRLGSAKRILVEANAEERAALAARMRLCGIPALSCLFELRRDKDGAMQAHGQLRATVRQHCVLSLEPFEAEVTEDFSVRFVPEERISGELDLGADDEIPYRGNTIDLGEAAAEQLALALDPFPRKPGAELG